MSKKRKRMTKRVKRLSLFIVVIILIGVLVGGRFFRYIHGHNVDISKLESFYIYIPNNTTFSELKQILESSGAIKDLESFTWVAQKKSYVNNIKGGRYQLVDGMSNNQLINMLRSGRQNPINFTFNNIRKIEQLASVAGEKLMVDSAELVRLLTDNEFISALGFDRHTLPSMFVPNTYQMYWNTDEKGFVERMKNEYVKFWNSARKNRADELGLSPLEVSILASIVDEETVMSDEKPKVAGLYLNRLRINMRLQADPTLKYALGDFSLKRILDVDKLVDSPYNTYKYTGLPPGPIRIPSITGIDAVLNAQRHKYLYMCAKEDFSGYHNFANTLKQHNVNAAKYQRELNKRRILR